MNDPFDARMFWLNIFVLLVLYALNGSHEEMYIFLVALVVLVYILQCLARIYNQIKRIADYLEKLKNERYENKSRGC